MAHSSQKYTLGLIGLFCCLTGFLQFFRQVHEPQLKPPIAELDPLPGFPGLAGLLPRDRSLYDFIRSLRISP